MKIKLLHIALLGVALLMAALSGCNNSGCTDNQNSLPLAGFYSADTGQPISLSTIDVGGVKAPDDSLLYKSGEALTEVYLPFRAGDSSTKFFIRYMQEDLAELELADTLTFEYTSRPYFASEECGAMYRYHIEKMDHTDYLIDKVVIVDSLITNVGRQRIHIYFRSQPKGGEQ